MYNKKAEPIAAPPFLYGVLVHYALCIMHCMISPATCAFEASG